MDLLGEALFRIVTVCTANICRSPLAELFLLEHLNPLAFSVSSAGMYARDGQTMDPDSERQARRFGHDGASLRASRITQEQIANADLILTATRRHRSELLEIDPMALRRTFTLTEFADLAALSSGENLEAFVNNVAANRSRVRFATDADYDITDPYRRPYEVHAQVATQIHETVTSIAARLNALVPPNATTP